MKSFPFFLGMVILSMALLSGCSRDAKVASRNISDATDNFQINRRIVFYNGITDKYMLTIEGKCSIEVDSGKKKLDVTCKFSESAYRCSFFRF